MKYTSQPARGAAASGDIGGGRRIWAAGLIFILLAGAVFRGVEYAADRSLWLDEAALAQNVLHLPLGDLAAGRLDNEQVAPPGFLLAARGVVTWAGVRAGYGKLIEVSHGNGFTTRYAHNERALVNVGDTVTRGEPIALMGSSGRSTGPHVHFEVLRNGHQVDPLTFIGR